MPRSRSGLPSSNFWTLSFSTLLLCFLIFSTLSFAAAAPDRIASINSSQTIPLAKSHHPRAQPQYDRGPVDPSFKLSYITLMMTPSASQQQALDQLLAQQQSPSSPLYHQWLTAQQYADQFGLSQNDIAKLTSWLKSQGFQIISVSGGRNTVNFSGTAAQAKRAFGTEIHSYEMNGEKHFANSTPVRLPAALNGIVAGVMGLHNFLPKPANGRRRNGAISNARPAYYDGNAVFPNFLAPDDIATIYDIGALYTAASPIDGTGEKLAIVGQTDVYLADLVDFRNGFNLPAITSSNCSLNSSGVVTACNDPYFKYVVPSGDSDPGTVYPCGDLSESDLDIEWSGATARKAQIIFVNSPIVYDSQCNPVSGGGVFDALTSAISPAGNPPPPPVAPVISMSYGYCEALFSGTLEPILQQGNSEGVTIMNSSGDESSAACDYDPPNPDNLSVVNPPFSPAQYGVAVSYPASSPEVTGVGGTAISLADDSYPNPATTYWSTTLGPNDGTAKEYIPELAWDDVNEWALFCQSGPTSPDNKFCTQGGNEAVQGWVPLTTSATPAQVQSDIWLYGGGGGASNCWNANPSTGECYPAYPGTSGHFGGFAQPSYQTGLTVPSAPLGVRWVPDVSLLASPNFPGYIFCTAQSELFDGGTSASSCDDGISADINNGAVIGGTSASSPVFAGIVTLLNEYLAGANSPGLGNINTQLYALAASTAGGLKPAFNQVTSGNNNVYCQAGTPADEPTNIVCPSTGVIGFSASNKDTAKGTGYNLVTGLGSVDANNLAMDWAQGRTASVTAVVAQPTAVVVGQSLTLTANVSPTTVVGTVTFFASVGSSSTQIGTAVVSDGVATVTTSLSAVGVNTITASFPGDGSDSPSTGTTLVTATTPSFSWTTSSTSHTVLAGQTTLAYSFEATPTGGATTFGDQVTFSCSVSPTDPTLSNSSCAFTPSSIAAGTASTGTTVTMTITTTGPNTTGNGSSVRRRADNRSPSPWLPLTLPIAGLVMLGLGKMRGKVSRKVSKGSAIALLCFSLALLGFMMACGGGGSSTPTVSVTVSPGSAQLYANETGNAWPTTATQQQFSATVNNATSQVVTWAVPSAGAGTISATGLYATPTSVPSPAMIDVTATSSATSTPGQASVTILNATGNGALPATYTVTVTATEAATAHSQNVTLTVQ